MENPNNQQGGVVSDAEGSAVQQQPPQHDNNQQNEAGNNNEGVQDQLAVLPARGPSNPQQPQLLQQQQNPPQAMPLFGPAWPPPPMIPPNHNNNSAAAAVSGGGVQPPPPPNQHAIAMAQYYEARVRYHAAAYASAAAGAAWAAAQIAAQAAEFAASTNAHSSTLGAAGPPPDPSMLPPPPPHFDPNIPPPAMPMPPVPPGMYYPAAAAPDHPHHPAYNSPMGGAGPPMGSPPGATSGGVEFYYNNNTNNGHSPPQQGEFRDGGGGSGDGDYFWQQQQYNHRHNHHHNKRNKNKGNDTDDSYEYRNNHNRKKRVQRRPPGGISIPRHQNNNNNHGHTDTPRNQNNFNNNNNNGSSKANNRRRLRDEHSSNSSCCSGSLGTSITSYNSDQAMGGYNSNSNNNNTNYGSSGRGGNFFRGGGGGRGNNSGGNNNSGSHHYHRYKKKQRQPPSDNSLYGKTPVAALHEWCNKRRVGQPSFALVSHVSKEVGGPEGAWYEFSVYLEDGVEWGRGRGTSKASAKSDAARKALMQLLPGVVFDPESGIVVELPSPSSSSSPLTSPQHQAAIGGGGGGGGRHNNNGNQQQRQPSSLEDLAPHLAQRLAIGSSRREDDRDGTSNKQRPGPRGSSGGTVDYASKKLKRPWNVYPGTTSTTNSEEDDENDWYASRGASVCSALLHAMVQIDDRIPEAPQYTFTMSETQTTNAQMKRKGPASSSSASAIVIHRVPFTCTATLKVLCSPDASGNGDEASSRDEPTECSLTDASAKEGSPSFAGKGKLKEDVDTGAYGSEASPKPEGKTTHVKVLEAVGIASTKRESRHSASAKLLAMLFPECKNMVEVKKTAEAAREAYAANKSKKQQSNRSLANANSRRRHNRRDRSKVPRLSLSQLNTICTPGEDDPPLPDFYAGEMQSLLGIQQQDKLHVSSTTICSQVIGLEKLNLNHDTAVESGSRPKEDDSDDVARDEKSAIDGTEHAGHLENSSVARQVSRQKQLEDIADKALQALNEHDEEGRSLPSQLTPDDVGRTVLRRATEAEDVARIQRLLFNGQPSFGGQLPPVSILGAVGTSGSGTEYGNGENAEPTQDCGALALRLWGSSTIVLLLCRAIAAFEDPPLGCAVLNLGFSMTKGKILRVAMIGSEPHLPRERFLECLDAFANCMGCILERQNSDREPDQQRTGVRLQKRDLESIVESHLGLRSSTVTEESQSASFSAPLQSVREESEGGEDSDRSGDDIGDVKGRDKPSKRSRVV